MDLSLRGFHARNRYGEKEQEIISLIDGDDDAVIDFKKLVETRKPNQAAVSNVCFEDYAGEVMRAGEYARVCTALQLNKAIPALLEIRDNTRYTPPILDEIKGLREEIQPGLALQLRQVQEDIRAIKGRLGMP